MKDAKKSSGQNKPIMTTFDELAKRENRSWISIGLMLDEVERTEYWQRDSGSFTEWIRAFRRTLGLREASLWRYLAVARSFPDLRATLMSRGVSVPALEKLPDSVSPENIELLSKLSRVVPADVLKSLAQKVVTGTITRAELRRTWQIYRPVLAGRTARGRGVPVPNIDPADPVHFESMIEAQVLTALTANGAGWLGLIRPDIYEVFTNVSPEHPRDVRNIVVFDAVVVARERRSDPLELHVIEVSGIPYRAGVFLGDLAYRSEYCDFFWVAVHERHLPEMRLMLPEHTGLIVARDNGIHVVQQARRTDRSGLHAEELAKGVLAMALRR